MVYGNAKKTSNSLTICYTTSMGIVVIICVNAPSLIQRIQGSDQRTLPYAMRSVRENSFDKVWPSAFLFVISLPWTNFSETPAHQIGYFQEVIASTSTWLFWSSFDPMFLGIVLFIVACVKDIKLNLVAPPLIHDAKLSLEDITSIKKDLVSVILSHEEILRWAD